MIIVFKKKKIRLEDDITVQRLARYRYSAHLHVKTATAEMDKFVIWNLKMLRKLWTVCLSHKHKSKTPSDQSRKRWKYQEEFIKYGFTCSIVNNVDFPQCVICSEVLAHESMKPGKMQRLWRRNILYWKAYRLFSPKREGITGSKTHDRTTSQNYI